MFGPFLFQRASAPMHRARSIKNVLLFPPIVVEELAPASKPVQHVWYEFKGQVRPRGPTSVTDLDGALVAEWSTSWAKPLLNFL